MDNPEQGEMMAKNKVEERRARYERKAAFRAQQPNEPPVMEKGERLALQAKAAAGPPENKAADVSGLEDKTKAELYDLAQAADIEGRSDMTKAELLEALRA